MPQMPGLFHNSNMLMIVLGKPRHIPVGNMLPLPSLVCKSFVCFSLPGVSLVLWPPKTHFFLISIIVIFLDLSPLSLLS